MTTFEKTKEAHPMGEYKPTAIDTRKADVDFRLIAINKNIITIIWKDGKVEHLNNKNLKNCQDKHSWACDF